MRLGRRVICVREVCYTVYMNLRRLNAATSVASNSNHSPFLCFTWNRLCQYASISCIFDPSRRNAFSLGNSESLWALSRTSSLLDSRLRKESAPIQRDPTVCSCRSLDLLENMGLVHSKHGGEEVSCVLSPVAVSPPLGRLSLFRLPARGFPGLAEEGYDLRAGFSGEQSCLFISNAPYHFNGLNLGLLILCHKSLPLVANGSPEPCNRAQDLLH